MMYTIFVKEGNIQITEFQPNPTQTEILQRFWEIYLNPQSLNVLRDLQLFQLFISSNDFQSKIAPETLKMINILIGQAREEILHNGESLSKEGHRAFATAEG